MCVCVRVCWWGWLGGGAGNYALKERIKGSNTLKNKIPQFVLYAISSIQKRVEDKTDIYLEYMLLHGQITTPSTILTCFYQSALLKQQQQRESYTVVSRLRLHQIFWNNQKFMKHVTLNWIDCGVIMHFIHWREEQKAESRQPCLVSSFTKIDNHKILSSNIYC